MEPEEQKNQNTYSERIETVKEQARKNAFNNVKEKQLLKDVERSFVERMLPLIENESFKAYREFQNKHIQQRLLRPYDPPSEALFKASDNGEVLAFNKGLLFGMNFFNAEFERLVGLYFAEKEPKKPEGKNGKN